MNMCHNINIIVKTTGGDASYISGKIESTNNKTANITIYLILNSINKKEL